MVPELRKVGGHDVLFLSRVDSTMDFARRFLEFRSRANPGIGHESPSAVYEKGEGAIEGARKTQSLQGMRREITPDGFAVVADYQWAGRGRRGARWICPPGRGLLMTVVLLEPENGLDAGTMSQMVSIAVVDACAETVGVDAFIKWPNDVAVMRDGLRKLGGVLVERIPHQPGFANLAGVGINIGASADDLPPRCAYRPASLAEEGVRTPTRDALLETLLKRMDYWRGGPPERIRMEWRSRTRMAGARVVIATEEGQLAGEVDSVKDDGALEVGQSDGTIVRIRPEEGRVISIEFGDSSGRDGRDK
ncbi:MAG TPA: biotin--[acetyl-CoA-carboxylase] ligase [Candidatus Brocadiia bacterium]|nr:biotin--[acetyl-CoA-carboxylase] ligase [Candidatus Brocadiia bacterium]